MIKQKQIEMLEEEIKNITGELMEATIEISNLRAINEEHRKLNGELREEIDRLNKSLEEQRHFYLKKIEKLENHKRSMLVELFKERDKIDKAIHRIQLLQMDGEVSIKDLGLIVRALKGDLDV